MNEDHENSLFVGAVRGAIAGFVATWLMDQVTTGLASSQSEADKRAEEAAMPDGRSSVGNLVARLEEATGTTLDRDRRDLASAAIHYALGVVPGALYGALGGRSSRIGTADGLLYGMALWALNDEFLNAKLGLSGPVDAYPMSTHTRGAVGHAVLGTTTDTVVRLLRG